MNSAPSLSGRRGAVLPRAVLPPAVLPFNVRGNAGTAPVRPVRAGSGDAEQGAPADQLWCEHGWGLGGGTVAALVGLVMAAACGAHLLG